MGLRNNPSNHLVKLLEEKATLQGSMVSSRTAYNPPHEV